VPVRRGIVVAHFEDAAMSNDAITLRDHFAAQILPAMLIAPKEAGVPRLKMEAMAESAYDFADAMMRARAAKPKE
jgi:hypothetical protein